MLVVIILSTGIAGFCIALVFQCVHEEGYTLRKKNWQDRKSPKLLENPGFASDKFS